MSTQRAQIYFVNLSPVQGREQAGKRPVLVLSIDTINQLPLNIPAWVCDQCGEVMFEAREVDSIQEALAALDRETATLVGQSAR